MLGAFAAVYLLWGSTFLGIRLAIDSIPPFLMAGSRFLFAGTLLYTVVRATGASRPDFAHWRNAAVTGALLLLLGNGAVSWAQKTVPSGITALIIAATPLWIMLVDWVRPGGRRPTFLVASGLIGGFAGVAMIVASRNQHGHRMVDFTAAGVLLFAGLSWAIGSIYSRHAAQPTSPLLAIAMQMITGGVLLLLAGFIFGETAGFDPARITARSAWAFAYLTVFGSLVGFTCYVWLLQVATPARVSTYAYVNPLIAALLGHVVLKEEIPNSVAVAGALILASVVLITRSARR
jgi:drug/metabolite transporter (DMT)-like permease